MSFASPPGHYLQTQATEVHPMQKIVPHLWFDTEAREAAHFYCGVFADSEVSSVTTLTDTPSGDCDVVSFSLCSYEFMAISAGPLFKINPSISFIVNFEEAEPGAAERLEPPGRRWPRGERR
jgi:predicted 3-demethylubiquinone-9 3-methyltransferase (glyoxalase superfamily)